MEILLKFAKYLEHVDKYMTLSAPEKIVAFYGEW